MRDANAAADAFGFDPAVGDHPPDGLLADLEPLRQRGDALVNSELRRMPFQNSV